MAKWLGRSDNKKIQTMASKSSVVVSKLSVINVPGLSEAKSQTSSSIEWKMLSSKLNGSQLIINHTLQPQIPPQAIGMRNFFPS